MAYFFSTDINEILGDEWEDGWNALHQAQAEDWDEPDDWEEDEDENDLPWTYEQRCPKDAKTYDDLLAGNRPLTPSDLWEIFADCVTEVNRKS